MGFEPTTTTLATLCSTPELHPLWFDAFQRSNGAFSGSPLGVSIPKRRRSVLGHHLTDHSTRPLESHRTRDGLDITTHPVLPPAPYPRMRGFLGDNKLWITQMETV